MPERSKEITLAGYVASDLLALSYVTLTELNWNPRYATDSSIVAYTRRSWNKYDDQVTVKAVDGLLVVSSKMIHDEIADLMGRNKKNIGRFLSVFETIRTKASEAVISEWKEKIVLLKEETIKTAEQEIKEAQEIDKVMNFSKSNLYVTYGIMAINIVVFVLMVTGGVSFITPTGIDIIRWGANFSPLTLSGDWWRLITCFFVHIGIIHLVLNMYALYMAGVYLEPLLGKTRYIVAYVCTGVLASLASLWWHKDPVPSAGASGAIFGLYGVFLAFLTTKFLPRQIRKGLLQSIGVFVVYNLIYGMKSGIDNAAHIGGLISGLVIGYLYYMTIKADNAEKKKIPLAAAIIVLTFGAAYFYAHNNIAAPGARDKVKGEIDFFGYKDADRFNEKYNRIIEMQDKAMVPLKNESLPDDQLADQLTSISLPEWEKADQAVKELMIYDVSETAKRKAAIMQQYITLRKEEIRLRLKWITEKDENVIGEINELNAKISKLVDELDRL
ncbi:MAG: rhomboid family intramembrane serine protease [Chitinophagaceae bacterium]|nr:rhomboid family intramembrane serine protease [Chitinophagaceae bacterium]